MGRGWFTGPGIGVLNGIFLRLDCTNDPLTAGLEINAATLNEPVLILQTTDDNAANPTLEVQNSAGAMLGEWQARGGLNFAAAVGQAAPGFVGVAGTRFLHNYGALNLFMGSPSGNFTLTASGCVGIGVDTLVSLSSGNYNLGMGYQTLKMCNIGASNVGMGYQALTRITSGSGCFGLGTLAVGVNATASYLVGIGYGALYGATGSYSIGIGRYAGRHLSTGHSNTLIGYYVCRYNKTGSCLVVIGHQAAYGASNQSHSNSVIIGWRAGYAITTGSGLVLLGYSAGSQLTNQSNRLVIANSNTLTPLVYGEFDTFRVALGTAYSVDKYGQRAYASGNFAVNGDAQGSGFVCRLAQASHAINTWYPLFPDGGATPERLTIAADTGWSIDVLVVGVTQNAAQQWGYQIYGLLERDNAGNTTLAATATTVLFESDANYDAQLAADDVNEALEVQVRRTGGVDYNVRWVATVRTAETSHPS